MNTGPVRKLNDDEALAEAIIGYLKDNPHAMDSIEGIAEFWVVRNTMQAEMNVLARVLNRLVEQGTLEQVGRGPKRLYRLTGAKRKPESNETKQ